MEPERKELLLQTFERLKVDPFKKLPKSSKGWFKEGDLSRKIIDIKSKVHSETCWPTDALFARLLTSNLCTYEDLDKTPKFKS